ncbi:DUF3050 domain-containing protein [Hugenholtzia roseola]|uniref:DUF3050 domain-containing protein n=1 Tax=Hugenholtzia roseola TaxID=1002 RepID=UPI0004092AB4|nr:DUF3050 domain-containing protein [Hugenholtzia roseola]
MDIQNNPYLVSIQNKIAPICAEIAHHDLYKKIKNIEDLKLFMQSHVFAVWDFMSLLKGLQRELTCVEVPWIPKGSPSTRALINEIVLGEESDTDAEGNVLSHFELYLQAMTQIGADTKPILQFLELLKAGKSTEVALQMVEIPASVRQFVTYTFEVINSKKSYLQAAVFTFGREDLIPTMFLNIVKDLDEKFNDTVSIFKYYLERHIEVDGDHHSHLALAMTAELCADDAQKWAEAEAAVVKALRLRRQLWDGVEAQIGAKKVAVVSI